MVFTNELKIEKKNTILNIYRTSIEPLLNFYRTSTELLPNLNQTSTELLRKLSQNLSQSYKKIHLKCNYFEPFFQPTVNSFLRRFPLHKLPIMWRRCKSFTLKKWPKAAAAAPQHSPVIYIFPKQFAVLLYPFLRQNGISKKHLMVSTKRREKALQLRVGIFCRENKKFFARHEMKNKFIFQKQ